MGSGAVTRRTTSSTQLKKTVTHPEAPKADHVAKEAPKGWAAKPQAATRFDDRVELGAPKPRPTPTATAPAPVPADVREALTTSWCNWVTENDVKVAHRSLEGLSMPDYQAALKELDQSGKLESYLGAMDVGQRAAFLEQAFRKGAIGAEPGEKKTGPFEPPASPRLYEQSAKLPAALRQCIHQGNLEAAFGYHQAYGEYVDRYAAGVMKQEDAAGIRKLGPPSPMAMLSEPGLDERLPEHASFQDDWLTRSRRAPTDLKAWNAISNRTDDLRGVVRPGTYWAQAEVEVVSKDGIATRASGIDLTVRDYGQVQLGMKESLGVEAGGGPVKGGLKLEAKGDVKLQRGLHPHVGSEVEAKANVQVGVPHGPSVGLETSSTGGRELTLNLDEHVGSYAKGNARDATLEGGVKLKKELSKDQELEGKLGLGMKGITQQEVASAIDPSGPGFFREPAERAAGVPWSKLPERKQQLYASLGWDAKSW